MKVLYFTTEIGWPLAFGAEIRRWNVLQGLLRAGPTDVVVFRRSSSPLATTAFAGCDRIIELPARYFLCGARDRELHSSTPGRAWLTLSSLLPYEYRSANPGELRAILAKELRIPGYGLLWFATPRTALFTERDASVPAILDGDDFSYIRNLGLLRTSPWYGAKVMDYLDAAKMWRWERGFPRQYSYVTRCSEEDRQVQPAKNVVVIPNGTAVPPQVTRAPSRRVLFVGCLGYPPNSSGVDWFLRKVWPRVRSEVPDACFDVVGIEPPTSLLDAHGRNGLEVHGFVEDLTPFYSRAALTIAPLFAGSGTRLKIIESLGRAVPVVSTTLGAYGIAAGLAHGLARCDSPEAFADACSHLLRHLEECAGDRAFAGRALVLARYSWKRIQGQVTALARHAIGLPGPPPAEESLSSLTTADP